MSTSESQPQNTDIPELKHTKIRDGRFLGSIILGLGVAISLVSLAAANQYRENQYMAEGTCRTNANTASTLHQPFDLEACYTEGDNQTLINAGMGAAGLGALAIVGGGMLFVRNKEF